MKVGDLVRLKNTTGVRGKVYLIMRTAMSEPTGLYQKVWIYPDLEADQARYDHTDDYNYYYDHLFEVVSESR